MCSDDPQAHGLIGRSGNALVYFEGGIDEVDINFFDLCTTHLGCENPQKGERV